VLHEPCIPKLAKLAKLSNFHKLANFSRDTGAMGVEKLSAVADRGYFPPTCRNFIDPVSSTKRVVEFRFQTAGLGQNSIGNWVKNALAVTFNVCGSTASRSGLAQQKT
jgi:hypothetical protein